MKPRLNVKGNLLRSRLLYVMLNFGSDAWSRVLARLSESDRGQLAEIKVDQWYPVEALDRLDRAIAEELGEKVEEVFERLGEFSATATLSGPYSSLLNPDIHSFLAQSALIHRSYQDFGEARYEPLSETSGSLLIRYEVAPPASFCISGSAYFRRAVELCGARAARISHPRCSARGDPVCEFHITWQP
jgi:uncharacterized protein (TIGR02265 family)